MDEDRFDRPCPRPRPWLFAFLIGAALLLAIGFFYMTEVRRERVADKVTDAATKVDRAADNLDKAAREAINRFDEDREQR
jgi:hypothetical protein